VAVTIGGPYGGGVSVTSNPYGYGYGGYGYGGYGGYGNSLLGNYSTLYSSLYGVPAPNPWPYSSGYAPGTNNYALGYSRYAPGMTSYSSGYSGYAPTANYYGSGYSGYAPSTAYGLYAPVVRTYSYPTYGYSSYSWPYSGGGMYGYRQGFVGGIVNRALRW